MSRTPGVVSAIVSSVDDPANLGRVQVQFDWMDGGPQSYWARVAAPMAGGKRGAFFMPELSDEVLVSFDQGDVSHPYIVGFCWSSADQPPFGGKQKQRGIMSVLGHQLLFSDDPASSKITLATPAGYAVTLDETGASLTLSIPTGTSLTLDASGITATVAAGAVAITAPVVTLTSPALTISSPALTIDATATTITGTLTVAGVVTATVVPPV